MTFFKRIRIPLFLIVFSFLFIANSHAQEAKHPIVPTFGGIYEIPGSVQPEADQAYRIVIDLKTLQRDKESINPGLNNVARMMNLHGLGGVQKDSLYVAVVIHGGATDVIIDNDAYQQRYELDNPNLELIDTLINSGAKIYVCGQSLLARNYAMNEINPKITIGLSMLTVFTTHVQQGFVPLVFD